MKLGTETNSLINHLMSGQSVIPEIGMGATVLGWTDRHPATVIDWDQKKQRVTVRTDISVRTDSNGLSESQEYEYTIDQKGSIYHYQWTDKGWKGVTFSEETKRWRRYSGKGLMVGFRERFYDFSF